MKKKLTDKPLAFDANKTVRYWTDSAEYDLSVAEAGKVYGVSLRGKISRRTEKVL